MSVLANGLAARSYQTSFVVPRGQHLPFFPLDGRVTIHVVEPDVGNHGVVSGLLKKAQLVFGLPADVDVAIANAFMTAYSVRFSKLIGRTKRGLYFAQHYEPVAFGEYGQGPAWLKLLKTKIAARSYRLGLECVTNSTWTSKMIREQSKLDSTVAPLGVDIKIFHPMGPVELKRERPPCIMTIGNANPVKRFDLFANTLKLLQTNMNCSAIVATHDPSLSKPVGTSVDFVFPKNDLELAALYNKASVFLSTSAWEGFGLPLLEAMACGTLIVTTDSGGIRDFCKDDFNCRIVESARAEDLAQAIMEVHANPDLEARLVQNGVETARQWPWERLIDSFDAILMRRGTTAISESPCDG